MADSRKPPANLLSIKRLGGLATSVVRTAAEITIDSKNAFF
jgi:hypothetical protein